MGWLFAIVMFVLGCFNADQTMIMTSGLYAIAGAIAFANKK